MKSFQILCLTFLFLSCGGYEIKNDKVYYCYSNEASGYHEILLEEADAKTFLVIENEEDIMLGSDKNHVFHREKLIEGADPNTFKRIGECFFVDYNSVYFFGFGADPKLDSVDVNSFELFDIYPWARDKDQLIYGHWRMNVDDLNSFSPIDESWGRTTLLMINRHDIYDSVDFQTFEIIDDYSGQDKNYLYEYGERKKHD